MKPAIASPLAGCGLAALVLAGFAAPAAAASIDAKYEISLLSVTLGTANLAGSIDAGSYRLDMVAKLTGLVGSFTGGRGSGAATGNVSGGRLSPTTFAVTSASSKESRTVRMALDGNAVQAVAVEPPVDSKPDRVPLTENHKRNVVDPLSAFLMPVEGKGGPNAACNRTLPIFDGAARYDIKLSYSGSKQVQIDGYNGPVMVCQARYVPIAGHRALRPSTKFMRENKDISIWLAPVAGTNMMVPVRISVRTMIGTAVIEASRFKVNPGKTASATQN